MLDEGVRGLIQGLAEQGFRDGDAISLTTYNAQGDLATGNAIARQVTTGEFDMVLTTSTPSMQAVANANRDGRVVARLHAWSPIRSAPASGSIAPTR